MSSWDTTTGPSVSPSLEKRARKREVTQSGNQRWIVYGDSKLGDSYPEYGIVLTSTDPNRYQCTCTQHYGGEYRKFCSHVLAVIYYRQANPDVVYDEVLPNKQRASAQDPGGLSSPKSTTEPVAPSTASALPPPQPSPVLISINGQTPQDLFSPLLEPAIPDQFAEFRSHQTPAIEEVVNLFNSGIKVVMLEAPTGTGKTLISEAVRRLVERSGIYTCTTKSLQNQVLKDFPYAKVLKGRNNYPTYDNPSITADVCVKAAAKLPACKGCKGWDKGASWNDQPEAWEDDTIDIGESDTALHCHFCHPVHRCAYEIAKGEALSAALAVLNTSYLLHEANGPGRFSKQDLIILDEADALERSELMSYVEVSFSAQLRKHLYVGKPEFVTKEDSWVEWIENKVIPALEADMDDIRKQLNAKGPVPKLLKRMKSRKNLLDKTRWLVKPTEDEEDINMTGWVLNEYDGTLTFKPVRVADHAQSFLWRHSQKFLVMSATIVSPEQMAADLGLEEGEWAVVHVPSTFPVQRRPIVLETVGKLSRDTKVWSYKAAADKVVEIAKTHPDERILVHTVSYELNKVIFNRLRQTSHGDRIETYFNSGDREAALERYLANPNGILLSPSFERGVDLPQDACRVIVVTKVPFPYLGDKQIKARLYGTRDGQMWYSVQTIRAICQMTGRGMRSKDDWCISYILDSSFQDLYGPNRRLFPEWWADAVVWDANDPKWKGSVLQTKVLTNQLGSV